MVVMEVDLLSGYTTSAVVLVNLLTFTIFIGMLVAVLYLKLTNGMETLMVKNVKVH